MRRKHNNLYIYIHFLAPAFQMGKDKNGRKISSQIKIFREKKKLEKDQDRKNGFYAYLDKIQEQIREMENGRRTDRQADRQQIDNQKRKWIDRQTDRQRDRQSDTRINRQTDKQRKTNRYILTE